MDKFLLLILVTYLVITPAHSWASASFDRLNQYSPSMHGKVVKGVVRDARIKAYPIQEQLGVFDLHLSRATIQAKTNFSGSFLIYLNENQNNQYYYLAASLTNQTQVKCDFHDGCISFDSGIKKNFGDYIKLPPEFTLATIIKAESGQIKNAPVTVLSQLRISHAESRQGGLSLSNLEKSERELESLFYLQKGSLARIPTDITNPNDIASANRENLYLGILLGAFTPYLQDLSWRDIDSLPSAEILRSARELASFLASRETASTTIRKLESIVSQIDTNLALSPATDGTISIINQPEPRTSTEGDIITLSVTAESDSELEYQWQKGGSLIPGATSSHLTFSPVEIEDAGTYSVRISSHSHSVHSNFIELGVAKKLSPVSIVSSPNPQVVEEGQTVTFNVVATGDGTILYQWLKDGVAILGANQSTYAINQAQTMDSGTYRVIVSNSVSSEMSSYANLEVTRKTLPVQIVQSPTGTMVQEGESVSFHVSVEGDGPLIYQWFKNGTILPDFNTPTLTISEVSLDDQGAYSVSVSNPVSLITSSSAYLSVEPAEDPTRIVFLSWDVPKARADGSELLYSDIEGYVIHYAREAPPSATTTVLAPYATDLRLELEPGEYKVQIATKTINGLQGEFSDLQFSID